MYSPPNNQKKCTGQETTIHALELSAWCHAHESAELSTIRAVPLPIYR
jgi:hypothetical protein